MAEELTKSGLKLEATTLSLNLTINQNNFNHNKCVDNNLNERKPSEPERGQWSGQLDFIFSCISYAVGLGNVWRFPYLVYDNGGGAFLVPNYICVIFCGIPLFLLEVSLGQYLNTGGIAIWNLVPIFKGIGFASMVMIGLCNIYYIILIAWTLFYLFNSFTSELPWSSCNNTWNSDNCITHTLNDSHIDAVSPVKEYWENRVLDITDGIHDLGTLRWELLVCLFVAWLLVYGVIWKGLHQSGKIIWFTATFPYLILFILFIRGVTLEGASKGLIFYLKPDWNRLLEAKVWVSAGTQVLFSYGIGIGANIALGSYNRYHHNFYRDSIIACIVSSGTSLFSGFVIFSVLGHMAHIQDKDVSQVAKSGPGLAFLAYPEVVTQLPISPLWSVLFFLMLLVLGIDSQFCTVEAFVTGVVDEWPRYLRPRRRLFTLVVVIIQFCLGIPLVMGGGMYIFQLMDYFSASGFSLLLVVFAEIVGICWVFGASNVFKNMKDMLGFAPLRWFYYCWVFFAPLIIGGIFLFSVIAYEPLVYADTYEYPWAGQLFGWILALSSVLCIPLYALYFLFLKTDQTLTLKERFLIGVTPNIIPRKEKDTVYIEEDSSVTDTNSTVAVVTVDPSGVLALRLHRRSSLTPKPTGLKRDKSKGKVVIMRDGEEEESDEEMAESSESEEELIEN